MTGLTLDAGALIALERDDRPTLKLLKVARLNGGAIAIPAGVLAQVWRDGARQARLARLLSTPDVEIDVLDDRAARVAGQLCGVRGTHDIVDASVVVCARSRGHTIVTSDREDLERLDPTVELIVV